MKRHVIYHFIKEYLGFITVYILNSLFIILFFYLQTNGSVSVFYPLSLSLFLLIIYLLIRYYSYKRFLQGVESSLESIDVSYNPTSYSEKQTLEVFKAIHLNYLNELNFLKQENKDKHYLISQWIHNLKTPIAVIDLLIQNAYTDGTLDHQVLNDMSTEKDKIIDQLEQLLNLFRIEDFSKDVLVDCVDLVEEVKLMINNRKKEFIHHSIYPRLEVQDTIMTVLTDKKWNQFMINQLISNAIKYSSKGDFTKHITFRIRREQHYIHLDIQDEGIGIKKHDLNRIFEPFFTGENGRNRKNATGIGLFVVNKVCKKLGHKINVESETMVGTTVTLSYKIERFS